MPFIKLKAQLVGLGERAAEFVSAINNNFRHLDVKKQNKFFIRSDDPAKIDGIKIEPRDIWIDTSSDSDFCTITIIQSPNQVIYVKTDDSSYSDNVTLPTGTHFTVTVIPDPGYVAGKTNVTEGTLFNDIIIYSEYPSGLAYTIYIQQSPNQTVYVNANGFDYIKDTVLKAGTLFTVRVVAENGFVAGTPNIEKGELTGNITIAATEAEIARYPINIIQSSHQTITVYVNSTPYTDTVEVDYGSSFTASIEADEGYIPGTLNLTSGAVTGNIDIFATSAVIKNYMIIINQSDNQTIIVTCNGRQYTNNVSLPYGSVYTVSIVSMPGYTAGTLSSNSGTLTKDVEISATPATIKNYRLLIVQSENQTIIVTINNTDYTQDVLMPYGTVYSVRIETDEGYTPGKLNITGGILTKDTTISATNAEIKMYQIHISKYENQVITVIADGNRYIDDISLPYGTQWSAEISANEGYTAGTLNAINGVLTEDIKISATPESINYFNIIITQYENQQITVHANYNNYTENISLPYGTNWTAYISASDGYIPGSLNIEEGILTEDIILTATEAILTTVNITITDSENQIIHVYIPDIDGEDHTESFICNYNSHYFAQSIPDMWWNAGELNIPDTGVFVEDTTITVEPVTPKTDYDLYITIAKTTEDNYGGVGFNSSKLANSNSSTEPFGSCSPNYISDGFCVYPSPYTNRSYFFFWGTSSVKGLFEYCSIILEDQNGETYTLGTHIPNSAFSDSGDIQGSNSNASFAFTQELFEWVNNRIGQNIIIHLHIE